MVTEIEHNNWQCFVNYVLDSMPLEGYFRGQWNPAWGLVPGAYRRFKSSPSTNEGASLDYAKEYMDLFKKYSSGVMADAHHLPENEEQLVIWAQNYGLITKLLDWSFSPFVASFFAFAECAESFLNIMFESGLGAHKHDRVAVWYIPRNNVPLGVKIERTISKNMHRQASQGSVFMIPMSDENFDISTMPLGRLQTEPAKIFKHLIPSEQCFIALESLRMMNIHYASLFPDLFGAAKQANFELLYNTSAELSRIVAKVSSD